MHAAKLLKSHIISSSYHFNGSLTDSDKAVPPVLSKFVTMLLAGPGVPDESSQICSEAASSVSQLVMFNAIKHRRHPPADKSQGPLTVCHCCSGTETLLPIYIGLTLHSATRMVWYSIVEFNVLLDTVWVIS